MACSYVMGGVYVCMCSFMYVCVCVFVCVGMNGMLQCREVCVCVCVYVFIHGVLSESDECHAPMSWEVCMRVCVNVFIHVCFCVWTYILSTFMYVCV